MVFREIENKRIVKGLINHPVIVAVELDDPIPGPIKDADHFQVIIRRNKAQSIELQLDRFFLFGQPYLLVNLCLHRVEYIRTAYYVRTLRATVASHEQFASIQFPVPGPLASCLPGRQ